MKPENTCTFLSASVLVYVTPEGLNDAMVIGTRTGAQDGPPTTVLAMTGTLMGAATGAAMWCVSCSLLVTDWGTRALLTIACTFAHLSWSSFWECLMAHHQKLWEELT